MYIFEDWRVFFLLTLVLMAFNTYIILFYLKESPKWLLANNKIDQYLETIRFIAKFNGDDNILSQMKTSPILSRNTSNQSLIAFRNYNYSITDLFTYKSLRLTTICGIYIWIVSGFSFYGLLLSLENFTGNIYLDSIVAYTAEFIAEIGSGIIADRYGRKPTILISFLIGSSCGLSLIVSNTILNCVILFVSCIGVAAAFNILYIYSTELYPTNVKSLAVSVFFVFSRLAATIVPYMLTVFPNVTLLICVSSIIAAFVMVKLPETLGSQIGDEIEEMKDNIFDDKVSDSSFNYVNLNNVSN
jgi:MFS family permease